jgi:hypothetical protein
MVDSPADYLALLSSPSNNHHCPKLNIATHNMAAANPEREFEIQHPAPGRRVSRSKTNW